MCVATCFGVTATTYIIKRQRLGGLACVRTHQGCQMKERTTLRIDFAALLSWEWTGCDRILDGNCFVKHEAKKYTNKIFWKPYYLTWALY
jgi:hypothetical protein